MASISSPSALAWRRAANWRTSRRPLLKKISPCGARSNCSRRRWPRSKAERGYAPKVIAITGTNGKTTVTSLVGLLCERAGLVTRVAGNISPAALDVLREVLDAEPAPQPVDAEAEVAQPVASTLPQAWILELSSFQLHTTFSLQADAATVLNLSQDHLDWHGDMAAYASRQGAHLRRADRAHIEPRRCA